MIDQQDSRLTRSPAKKRSKHVIVIAGGAGAVIIGAVAAFAFFTAKSGHKLAENRSDATVVTDADRQLFRTGYDYEMGGKSLDDLDADARAYAIRDQEWAAAARFIPIAEGPDSIATAWASSLEDPSGVLTTASASSLLHTIAQRAWVCAQNAPDAYSSLIESDSGLEWNDPDPAAPNRIAIRRRNAQIGVFYSYLLDEDYDPTLTSQAILPTVWQGLVHFDHLPREIGVGPKGARILVINARAPAQLQGYGLKGKDAPKNADYWWSSGARYGMEFSRPVVSATDMLADRPSLTVALVNIIVRLRDGRLGNWQSVWYLHPETNTWVLNTMQATSGKTVMLVW